MESSLQAQRTRLAELLVKVADGVISSHDAIALANEWKDIPWKQEVFAAAYHGLQHVEIDADIRQRDADYAKAQDAGLRRCAERLLKFG